MKIFLVTKNLSGVVGGVERQLGNIAVRLEELGHQVVILSSDTQSPDVFYSLLSNFPLRHYGRESRNPHSKNRERFFRQRAFQKITREEKPDLIIGFMLSGYLVALPSAKSLGVPILLAERNSPDVYNLTRARKFKFLYFQLMRFTSGITVQLNCYVNKYPTYLQRKIKVIYNEIMLTPKGIEGNRSDQDITFGFVGRFSFQKQPLQLIESFSRHVALGGESKLVFFGKGELEADMRKLIKQNKLERYVQIEQPMKNLDQIYTSIDVLCLPSLWEGFPNVVGEAMAYGRPILGNINCLGLDEIVIENVGVLVDFENSSVDGFEQIKQLISAIPDISTKVENHFRKIQDYNFHLLWDEVVNDAVKPN